MSMPWQQGPFLPETAAAVSTAVEEPAAMPRLAAPAQQPVAGVPAGWYPDPTDASRRRWWDGAAWTPETFAAPAEVEPVGLGAQPSFLAPAGGFPGTVAAPAASRAAEPTTPRFVGPVEAVSSGYARMLDFGGRATRAEYWWFYLWTIVAVVGLVMLLTPVLQNNTVFLVFVLGVLLAFSLPSLSLLVRRLHDAGFSGWWVLVGFVPGGGLALFVLSVLPSKPGWNSWGRLTT